MVVAEYPIPAGGRLNNVHLECHVIAPETVEFNQVVMYGISGFVVPVPDPDSAINIQTLWDNLIPKDVDESAGVFDLDTAATDTTPEFEMGEADWSGIFRQTGLNPIQIFKRRKMLSCMSNLISYQSVSAAVDLWTPGDLFTTDIKRNVSVAQPSMVMFGFSSPSLDRTNQTEPTAPTEIEWTLLQYLEVTLENAFMNLIGLVETGAETPFEESAEFIASLIEDDAFEQTAAAFLPANFNVFTKATFDISVPGTLKIGTLTSDAG